MSRAVGVLVAVVALLVVAAPSQAAFPGKNGKIAFASNRDGDYEIYLMNPDGSGQTPLTSNTINDQAPAWSPDGTKIAFIRVDNGHGELWVMDADGLNPRLVASDVEYWDLWRRPTTASWSPDGQQIAFVDQWPGKIAIINADGTGRRRIEAYWGTYDPAWSPSGAEIAFKYVPCTEDGERCGQDSSILAIRPDGTGIRSVTAYIIDEAHTDPDWSPTGAQIAFNRCTIPDTCEPEGIYVIDADGTDESQFPGLIGVGNPAFSPDGERLAYGDGDIFVDGTRVTTGAAFDTDPDWQPIPVNAYSRPKSANWIYASLVPAFAPCSAPNRTHGPPLAFDSCAPPQPALSALTVGTPDANGTPVKSTGHVSYLVQTGNPSTPADEADVRLKAAIGDVRNAGTLTDYAGGLSVKAGLRITDKDNTPHPGGPGAATVADGSFAFDVPCAATDDPTVGSTCSVLTSADAVLAGAVKERLRSVWELGSVEVYDGADQLFMMQGVFVP